LSQEAEYWAIRKKSTGPSSARCQLPATKLPVKRRKSVEKLDLFANKKEELARDMYYYKVLTQDPI